jgi:hypothetical protein
MPAVKDPGVDLFVDKRQSEAFAAQYDTNRNLVRGLYVLNFGRESKAIWKEVPGTVSVANAPGSFVRLMGNDGSHLVYLRTSEEPEGGSPTLSWVKP